MPLVLSADHSRQALPYTLSLVFSLEPPLRLHLGKETVAGRLLHFVCFANFPNSFHYV